MDDVFWIRVVCLSPIVIIVVLNLVMEIILPTSPGKRRFAFGAALEAMDSVGPLPDSASHQHHSHGQCDWGGGHGDSSCS